MAVEVINVYITNKAGYAEITVDQPIAGVHSGSSVIWEFHSVVPNVNWAQIDFPSGSTFFKARPGAAANVRYTELKGGHGEILGTAPELGPPGPKSRQDKYWVRVYKDPPVTAGTATKFPPTAEVPEPLDPDIIICDP